VRPAIEIGPCHPGLVRVLFLDVDGVLNRTGFRPEASTGLSSWIEAELGSRLQGLVGTLRANVVLCSDWRVSRTLEQLNAELHKAGVTIALHGVTPVIAGAARWREIAAWMSEHQVAARDIVIIDDERDMGALATRHVRISPLCGLDEDSAGAVRALFEA
jgi:HAD domain in Swiss Army Knife RNA repair proteins